MSGNRSGSRSRGPAPMPPHRPHGGMRLRARRTLLVAGRPQDPGRKRALPAPGRPDGGMRLGVRRTLLLVGRPQGPDRKRDLVPPRRPSRVRPDRGVRLRRTPLATGRAPDPAAPGRARTVRDRGVASLEYLGMLPFLLLIALSGIQLGLVAYCGIQAGTAARTAARTAAEGGDRGGEAAGRTAGRQAVSDWLSSDTAIGFPEDAQEKVTARASVRIPSVLPGVHLFGPVERSATMPKEDWTP